MLIFLVSYTTVQQFRFLFWATVLVGKINLFDIYLSKNKLFGSLTDKMTENVTYNFRLRKVNISFCRDKSKLEKLLTEVENYHSGYSSVV